MTRKSSPYKQYGAGNLAFEADSGSGATSPDREAFSGTANAKEECDSKVPDYNVIGLSCHPRSSAMVAGTVFSKDAHAMEQISMDNQITVISLCTLGSTAGTASGIVSLHLSAVAHFYEAKPVLV